MLQAIIIFCLIGYFSGSVGNLILTRPRIGTYLDFLTAGIFTSLGIRLALVER
jgi:threonine/homoserine/homoserine lactone efflux protein